MLLHPHGHSAIHTPHRWVPLSQRQCLFSTNTQEDFDKVNHMTLLHAEYKCEEVSKFTNVMDVLVNII